MKDLRQFIKTTIREFLNEGYEKDSEKIIFSRKYSDGFFDHCKKNIKKIVKTLLSDAYYEFKLYDLNVVLTIDDLVNANGNRVIGEYDDEINKLRIVLFSYFKRFLDGLDDRIYRVGEYLLRMSCLIEKLLLYLYYIR